MTGSGLGTLILIGAIAGLFSGFFGVGGGFIMVPLLTGLAKFDQHRAHATSLAAIVLIALAATVRFAMEGEVDWVVGLLLGAGGMVGSTLGAGWMNRMDATTLRTVFSVIVVIAGAALAIGGEPPAGSPKGTAATVILSIAIGLGAGIASGLAGIGGGVVMVPAMVFFLGLSQHNAEGTSLLAIFFTALAGTRVNLAHDRVQLRDAVSIGLAGLVLAPLGATAALELSGPTLARAFGIFVVLVGIRMLAGALRARRVSDPVGEGAGGDGRP